MNFCYETILPTRLGKRKKRVAKLNVKYTEVKLIQPKNNKNLSLLPKIFVTVLDISEDKSTVEKNEKALHWRLITTHKINSQKDGENIITWYKKRWNIEQLFRTMKLKGFFCLSVFPSYFFNNISIQSNSFSEKVTFPSRLISPFLHKVNCIIFIAESKDKNIIL